MTTVSDYKPQTTAKPTQSPERAVTLRPKENGNSQQRTTAASNYTSANKSAREGKKEIVQGKNESTTEYLNRKAQMDQKEHAREVYEQKIAERSTFGYLNYAGRWMDGDPVPNGQRLVRCDYCGADNLVPVTMRQKYNCYFCREEL